MAYKRLVSLCAVALLIVSAIVLGFVGGLARATTYPTPAYHFEGTVAGEFSAWSMALLDLNKDGVTDLAVGAPFNGTGSSSHAGSVTFYLSQNVSGVIVPFHRVVTVSGLAAEDLFGWSLANVGNVNGAGPALAVGAPQASPARHLQAGGITLFFPSTSFNGRPNAWINSTNPGEELGYSLAGGGDINGDNFDDILAGAPFCSTGAAAGGCAYVYYGASPRPGQNPAFSFDSIVAGAHFGWSIAGNGSVDGNSQLDLVVGAPNYTTGGLASVGAAYIIRNPTGVVKQSIVTGVNAGDQFGTSVALGDFSGDTIGDIAIGAPYYTAGGRTSRGSVSIIYGSSPFKPTIGLVLTGERSGDRFGSALAAGNFHRDNVDDLLVGAPGSRANATGVGRAYGFYGSPVPWTAANLTLVPGVAGDNAFGSALAVGGNFTTSGVPSFAVGDPQFQNGSNTNVGRAYVYTGDIVPTLTLPRVVGWVCVPFTYRGGVNPCIPIGGAVVTLESAILSLSTSSAANGSFSFTAVPGTYWLNTTVFPYVDNSTSFSLEYNQTKTVVVFPYTIPVVAGTVKDVLNATGYAGISVALYNATNVLVNATTTGALGAYSMYVPTRYIPAVGAFAAMTVRAWDPFHYAGNASVSIQRNATSQGNVALNRFPLVTGKVANQLTLAPIPGAIIQATQGSTGVATATTNGQGLFTLVATNALVPGRLYLNVTRAGFGRQQTSLAVNQNGSYGPLYIYLLQDQSPPSSNVWPLLSTYTNHAVFTVSANATDNNGVQQVQLWYRFNNTGSPVEYGAVTASPYAFSFNSTAARGDGRYAFYTVAVDYAGNTETPASTNETWSWVDTVRPSLTVTKPTTNQALLTSWVNVTWTATDAGSGLLKSDVQLDSGTWMHAGLARYLNLTSVPDGTHTVTVNATDRAGNSRSAAVPFSVNTSPPVVTFSAPANQSLSKSATVSVSWTVTNPGSGITQQQVAVDSGAWQTIGASDTSHTFAGLTDGSHRLWVRASTAETQTSVFLQVTVDTTPPSVTITSPKDNPWTNTSSLNVAFTATDATSGVASLTLAVDGGTAVDVTNQASRTITGLSDGTHDVTLTATDAAGNSATATADFRVDTVNPTVTFSAPADGATFTTTTVEVDWQVSDSGSGVATVRMSLDGGSYQTLSPGGTTAYAGLSDGQHTVTVVATDAAGNTVTKSVSFTVNTEFLGSNVLTAGIIGAIVIIVVVVALVVWRMRSRKTPPPPKDEPPKPEESEKKS